MRYTSVIFSFKFYKVFLASGLFTAALGMDSAYQNIKSIDLLLLGVTFHLASFSNLFAGTIIVTKRRVIFVMSFMVKARRKSEITRFELDSYVWWVQRLRLVAVMQNGMRLLVSDVNKAVGDERDTHPESLARRLNLMLASNDK